MKLLLIRIFFLMASPCFGEMFRLGHFDLAGGVPPTLPVEGARIRLEIEDTCDQNESIPLRWDAQVIGYIPARLQLQIREMQLRGVQLELRVLRVHPKPAPGAYLEVELWAASPDVRLLIPLIEAEEEKEADYEEEWEG
jgi:hypothetical protein